MKTIIVNNLLIIGLLVLGVLVMICVHRFHP